MTIEERLKEVWWDDVRMRGIMPTMYARSDYEVTRSRSDPQWDRFIAERAKVEDRLAFGDRVKKCKKTKRIIKDQLMQAATSEFPYIREFAKLIVKEENDDSARQGKKKSKLGQVGGCYNNTCSDWSR